VQKWAGERELAAARGSLRVEYKKVGGRHIGANLIPGRAWVDGYEQAWALLGTIGEVRRQAALTEQTKAAELLDLQLESGRTDPEARDFEARFRFRRKPAYVRFRCSADNSGAGQSGFSELTVRADELTAPPPGIVRVYIVENEVTYLAFPLAADAMLVFGGGYAVPVLELLAWLTALDVVYWGDIDTHGFAILNRLRHHVPQARYILMDRATLLAHREQWPPCLRPVTVRAAVSAQDRVLLFRSLELAHLEAPTAEQAPHDLTAQAQATPGRN
jgi:hypothetical protein